MLPRVVRDAYDVLRHTRGLREGVRALLPGALRGRRVLNEAHPPPPAPTSATELAAELRRLRNRLEVEALVAGKVDYARLRAHEAARDLARTSQLLVHVRPEQLASDAERLAFWINLYNVLVIHGVLALEVARSVMEVPALFGFVAYRVGAHTFTPDEVENGVLRRNRPHPATRARPFAGDDPRLTWCPTTVDPRIHAALVCASTACPPVAFYEPERLEEQLAAAARAQVALEVELDEAARVVRLPITFHYYREDYADGVPAYLVAWAAPARREALARAFAAGWELEHRRWDWSLNEPRPAEDAG